MADCLRKGLMIINAGHPLELARTVWRSWQFKCTLKENNGTKAVSTGMLLEKYDLTACGAEQF